MNDRMIQIPEEGSRIIVRLPSLFVYQLCNTDGFIKYCKERNVPITHERLLCLEKLGLFSPLFRVRSQDDQNDPFYIPLRGNNDWFDKGLAWDTTIQKMPYKIPELDDETQEGYYSVFQIHHLHSVVSIMTIQVHLDNFIEHDEFLMSSYEDSIISLGKYVKNTISSLRSNEQLRVVPLLCQCISDRYGPLSKSNQRTMRVPLGGSSYCDRWLSIYDLDWSWNKVVQEWNPSIIEKMFQLTPTNLRQCYERISGAQKLCDPLSMWYKLVQFVPVDKREKLKGDALRAEVLRSAAYMLRLLYRDLYHEELPHPNEVGVRIINYFPELEVRKDIRRYLELVVNQFDLNPQPKATIFVEGPSEEATIVKIFENYYGVHPGKYGIELICLGGVDVATGNKEDRFRAILRLIDYLHHHQTFTFLMLDNENYAKKLKIEAQKAKSILHKKRYITRPEYIKIWKTSFEFDNYSATEITDALNELANNTVIKRKQVIQCIKGNCPGGDLSRLYKRCTTYGLNKIKLNEILVQRMLTLAVGRKVSNRPIVKFLNRVVSLAVRNPFPTRQESWEKNQSSKFLGKKRN